MIDGSITCRNGNDRFNSITIATSTTAAVSISLFKMI